MLMVIFGAGASFDSVPERDMNPGQKASYLRPPLAPQLFEHRPPFAEVLLKYPRAVGLIQELRHTTHRGEPVESALQRYAVMAEEGDDGTARQLIALRFYLHDIIGACSETWLALSSWTTNYAALINRIERARRRKDERVMLVTFNYDLLLEAACGSIVGEFPKDLDDYVSGHYVLVKPHGSINWSRLARYPRKGGAPKQLIEEAGNYQLTDTFIMESTDSDGKAPIPAIAVPTLRKSIFECPPLHLKVLRENLKEVDVLLVIGWSAQEQSFLELLAEHPDPASVRGLVVCGNEADTAEAHGRIMGAIRGDIKRSTVKGFSDFLLTEKHLDSYLR